MLNLIDFKKS